MTSSEIRKKYLEFFQKKGHKVVPSASLVPENDPTTLFITAGMQPLIPYLLGEPHPEGSRLVGAQKILRTDDIEEVGDPIHHTFFEMLGNWSLGDYFKKDAVNWSYEFLTSPDFLNIPREKLAVSIFAGDEDAPFDEESYNLWLELGISEKRIAKLPKKNNWWGPAGQTGPCGPDTEIFYWATSEEAPVEFDPTNPNWVEIWNNVFMEFNKNVNGKFEPLKQQNVDTGMGLERTAAVLQGSDDNYQTDLFLPIIEKLEEYLSENYDNHKEEFRIIADHIKAATFLIKDGVLPSNKLQGYVLRRLLRRAAIKINQIKDDSMDVLPKLVDPVLDIYKDTDYFQVGDWDNIRQIIEEEISKFQKTIKQGLKEIEKLSVILSEAKDIEKIAFDLYQSYGFPVELTSEILNERDIHLDMDKFKKEQEKHKELSQTTSAGMFKGGLADQTEQTTKLHTATHMLQAAAKQVLGDFVGQRGSHITAERLRWDFNYPQKLTQQQIKQLEAIVNQKIQEDLKVWFEVEDRNEAIKGGVTTNHGENYPDKVKVYKIGLRGDSPSHSGAERSEAIESLRLDSIGPSGLQNDEMFSQELCGGPHVVHTSILGTFKIIKEEGISAGVRRIYATVS